MNPIEFFDPESDSPLTIPELKSSMLEYCSRKEKEKYPKKCPVSAITAEPDFLVLLKSWCFSAKIILKSWQNESEIILKSWQNESQNILKSCRRHFSARNKRTPDADFLCD